MKIRHLLVLAGALALFASSLADDCWITVTADRTCSSGQPVNITYSFYGMGHGFHVKLSDELGHVFYQEDDYNPPTYPITAPWEPDPWEVPDGWHTISADLTSGSCTAHAEVRIQVDRQGPDVAIGYPAEGQYVSDTVTISAGAHDAQSGCGPWRLYADGVLVDKGVGCNVSGHWDVSNLEFGSRHTLYVESDDNCKNTTRSKPVDVYVGVEIQGTVGLDWFIGSPKDLPIHVSVLTDTGHVTETVPLDENGHYSAFFDVVGVHDVILKPVHWLPVKQSLLLKDTVNFDAYFQVNGDATDDSPFDAEGHVNGDLCRINLRDIVVVLSCFNSKVGDADFDIHADSDGSGSVCILDFCVMLLNYGMHGFQ